MLLMVFSLLGVMALLAILATDIYIVAKPVLGLTVKLRRVHA